ncbi:hypothetical protein AXG93_441s1150 [Marchantia polymorpha subsp. ruderalis]|uniref:Uncharacterized protein n=1 Tax=Marchantia polymorpha subsp. ruderalis TaxID=1480154 RepID=A0A176W2Q9_MARPO|nr:hypothetical protein AXG93_441s1150 [Marchantia polymorpha subsp. ruderalis]
MITWSFLVFPCSATEQSRDRSQHRNQLQLPESTFDTQDRNNSTSPLHISKTTKIVDTSDPKEPKLFSRVLHAGVFERQVKLGGFKPSVQIRQTMNKAVCKEERKKNTNLPGLPPQLRTVVSYMRGNDVLHWYKKKKKKKRRYLPIEAVPSASFGAWFHFGGNQPISSDSKYIAVSDIFSRYV